MRLQTILPMLAATLLAAPAVRAQGPVAYFARDQVAGAFAKGSPLLEVAGYKIHASRREAPGQAEVHERDTDIIYVLEGRATFVTGGTVIDGKTIAKEEIRGASIAGGDTLHLGKGDVIVVPNGTPHWFREVEGPFLYYVVKVSATPPCDPFC